MYSYPNPHAEELHYIARWSEREGKRSRLALSRCLASSTAGGNEETTTGTGKAGYGKSDTSPCHLLQLSEKSGVAVAWAGG